MKRDYWKSFEVATLEQAISRQVVIADDAWSTAFGISAGSGCTPFYAAAREREAKLVAMMLQFKKLAGRKKLRSLDIRKRVGVEYPK